MAGEDIIQELRERLIKIETLLEQKFIITDTKFLDLEKRVGKLEDNNIWLWRAIACSIIGCVVAFFFKK